MITANKHDKPIQQQPNPLSHFFAIVGIFYEIVAQKRNKEEWE